MDALEAAATRLQSAGLRTGAIRLTDTTFWALCPQCQDTEDQDG